MQHNVTLFRHTLHHPEKPQNTTGAAYGSHGHGTGIDEAWLGSSQTSYNYSPCIPHRILHQCTLS